MARRRRADLAEAPTGTTTAAGRAGRTREPVPPAALIETYAEDWLRPGEHAPPTPRTGTAAEDPQAWAWTYLAAAVQTRQGRARSEWAHAQGLTAHQMRERYPRAWRAARWRTVLPVMRRASAPEAPGEAVGRAAQPAFAAVRTETSAPARPRRPRAPIPTAPPRVYRAVGWHPGHGWHDG